MHFAWEEVRCERRLFKCVPYNMESTKAKTQSKSNSIPINFGICFLKSYGRFFCWIGSNSQFSWRAIGARCMLPGRRSGASAGASGAFPMESAKAKIQLILPHPVLAFVFSNPVVAFLVGSVPIHSSHGEPSVHGVFFFGGGQVRVQVGQLCSAKMIARVNFLNFLSDSLFIVLFGFEQ